MSGRLAPYRSDDESDGTAAHSIYNHIFGNSESIDQSTGQRVMHIERDVHILTSKLETIVTLKVLNEQWGLQMLAKWEDFDEMAQLKWISSCLHQQLGEVTTHPIYD